VVEQIADADLRGILGGVAPRLQLRDVGFGRRIERQLAVIAQLQDRQRGERLAHRGDAEQRLRCHRPFRHHILDAGTFHVHEASVLDDAPDQAGNVGVEAVVLHLAVDLREDGRCLRPGRGPSGGDDEESGSEEASGIAAGRAHAPEDIAPHRC
jgi:hypothetical protein